MPLGVTLGYPVMVYSQDFRVTVYRHDIVMNRRLVRKLCSKQFKPCALELKLFVYYYLG